MALRAYGSDHTIQTEATAVNVAPYSQAFRGAELTKNTQEWNPQHRSGDSALRESWDLMTARLRDSFDNIPQFSKADERLTTLTIGSGLMTYAAPIDAKGELIEDFADESDKWYRRWADEEFDAKGERSLWEAQRLSLSETTKVGSCLWLRTFQKRKPNGRARISPLSYREIEFEQIARDYDTPTGWHVEGMPEGHRIINGIELNRADQTVAIWLYLDHPYDTTNQFTPYKPNRVPIDRIVHNFMPNRVSAHTGVSWYTSMMMPARDVDRVIGRTLTALGVSALLTLVVKSSQNKSVGLNTIDPDTGLNQVGMGHPYFMKVGAQDSVEVAESKKGVFELSSLLDNLRVTTAQAAKMSENRLSGDASKANMASIRAAHNDDESMFAVIRDHQRRRIAENIRREFNNVAVATGLYKTVSAEKYDRMWWDYNEFDTLAWKTGGDVDEGDAIAAALDALRGGLSSFQRECGKRGFNWRYLFRSRKFEQALAEKYGITLDLSKGQGNNTAAIIGVPPEPIAAPESAAGSSGSGSNGNGKAKRTARRQKMDAK